MKTGLILLCIVVAIWEVNSQRGGGGLGLGGGGLGLGGGGLGLGGGGLGGGGGGRGGGGRGGGGRGGGGGGLGGGGLGGGGFGGGRLGGGGLGGGGLGGGGFGGGGLGGGGGGRGGRRLPSCPRRTGGQLGICAFTCTVGQCGVRRECCRTACGGSRCVRIQGARRVPRWCPRNSPRLRCFVNPCQVLRCPAVPWARCVNHNIGFEYQIRVSEFEVLTLSRAQYYSIHIIYNAVVGFRYQGVRGEIITTLSSSKSNN